MDYLTNFYKNKAQVLSEQVAILEAKLASLQEDAPASTFSGTGQGQQTFSDEQLRDQMRQHKRTGLFGAQVDDAKQDQEYRDAQAELNRRSSASSAKSAPQPQSQPQARQSAPQQTSTPKPQAQAKPQPQSAPVDRSQLYTGDDSWLKDATAPAKLPGSFAGDRGDSGNAPKSSEPTRHYGEPATLPQQEQPKFDVMSATRNLLDQMNKKSAQTSATPQSNTPPSPSSANQKTPEQNAAQVAYDSESRATRGMPESDSTRDARLAKQKADRNANAARVKADAEARATRGMNYGNPSNRGMQPQTQAPAPEEQHTLMGDLGHAFYDAGRALFNLPRDVNKALKNGTGVNYEAFPGARK